FFLARGMLDYRAGRYAPAIESLERSRAMVSALPGATSDLFMAMAYQKIGKRDEAQSHYKEAAKLVQLDRPRPGIDLIVTFENWLVEQIALREAQAMFGRLDAVAEQLRILNDAVDVQPDAERPLIQRGQFLARLGR